MVRGLKVLGSSENRLISRAKGSHFAHGNNGDEMTKLSSVCSMRAREALKIAVNCQRTSAKKRNAKKTKQLKSKSSVESIAHSIDLNDNEEKKDNTSLHKFCSLMLSFLSDQTHKKSKEPINEPWAAHDCTSP